MSNLEHSAGRRWELERECQRRHGLYYDLYNKLQLLGSLMTGDTAGAYYG